MTQFHLLNKFGGRTYGDPLTTDFHCQTIGTLTDA